MQSLKPLIAAAALLFCANVLADINVGVTLSATGPAASLGIPEKNTIEMLGSPTIGGQKINFIVLDDKSDTTEAVKNTRKLIGEDKVDVIVGSTVTPNSLAMRDVVVEAEVPMISMAASALDHQPGRSEDALGVQDTAERFADGGCGRDQHESEWREHARLHRLRRCLRGQLAGRDQAIGADRRHQGRRRREIQSQRSQRDRTGVEAARGASPTLS